MPTPKAKKQKNMRSSGRTAPELIFGNLWNFDPAPETAHPKVKATYDLFIDGKSFLDQQMIIVLGVTMEGSKIPIGLVQSANENALPIENLLKELIERGLKVDEGMLCVIDGSKGIKKALVNIFGQMAVIQRCQWHKRENVLSYLSEEEKEIYKIKIQNAYQMEDYQMARDALEEIAKNLEKLNKTAANSLREGLEETLTLHRLGVNKELRKSFSTTNCIESVNSQIKKYVGRITRWVNSDQRYRWAVAALMEAEVRMRKVNGSNHLKSLKSAIKMEVSIT
jgi:transposase-like protein